MHNWKVILSPFHRISHTLHVIQYRGYLGKYPISNIWAVWTNIQYLGYLGHFSVLWIQLFDLCQFLLKRCQTKLSLHFVKTWAKTPWQKMISVLRQPQCEQRSLSIYQKSETKIFPITLEPVDLGSIYLKYCLTTNNHNNCGKPPRKLEVIRPQSVQKTWLKVFDVNLSEFSHISQKKMRDLICSALPDPIQLRGILSHFWDRFIHSSDIWTL